MSVVQLTAHLQKSMHGFHIPSPAASRGQTVGGTSCWPHFRGGVGEVEMDSGVGKPVGLIDPQVLALVGNNF